MVTPIASLATMLVLALARREGHDVRAGRLVLLWVSRFKQHRRRRERRARNS